MVFFHFFKLLFDRDQLIQQLEKSQDMLMNFQQELNATEQELQKQREENKRLVVFKYTQFSIKTKRKEKKSGKIGKYVKILCN